MLGFFLFQRKLKQWTVKNKIQPEFFFCINGLNMEMTGTFSQNKWNGFVIEQYKLCVSKGDKCDHRLKSTCEF